MTDAPRDPLPSPGSFDVEIRELVARAQELRARYRAEYRIGLEAPSGEGVRVAGSGNGSPTESTFAAPLQRKTRAACRNAVRFTRDASRDLQMAEAVLAGAEVSQPRKVDQRAVVSQEDFDRALHLKRERVLRGEE